MGKEEAEPPKMSRTFQGSEVGAPGSPGRPAGPRRVVHTWAQCVSELRLPGRAVTGHGATAVGEDV